MHNKKQLPEPNREEILKFFGEKSNIKVLTPLGLRDTFLAPLDSLKHNMALLQCGLVAIEPKSGNIKAWVGGVNHQYFKYDQVLANGKQIGSLVKGLNYLSAVENGIDPCKAINGGPNIPLIDLMCINHGATITPAHIYADSHLVKDYLIKLKLIDSTDSRQAYHYLYGNTSTNLLQTTIAFNSFNNGGNLNEPNFVTAIYKGDSLIYKSKGTNETVFSLEQANATHAYYKKLVYHGSGMRLISSNYYGIKSPIAGIDGSTAESNDNWYIGFTPELTFGIWVGSNIPKVGFRTLTFGYGYKSSMPIFGQIVNDINSDSTICKSKKWFQHNRATIHCR